MTDQRSPVRRLVHRFAPGHFEDPLGLIARLLRTGDRSAYFALWSAGLGALTAPLDLLWRGAERRLYAAAKLPERPIILVCGPPRSGTTLVAQVLIHNLPVAFFPNLTSVFPRSPLVAIQRLGPRLRPPVTGYRSYYGKAAGWSSPNDALYLWDRWLGPDRARVPKQILPEAAEAMRRFFGAAEGVFARPIVAKNNNLVGAAPLVAPALPTAHFVCLDRDPVFLAQALLIARREIHGTDRVPYGLSPDEDGGDPIESVSRQVTFLRELGTAAADRLGPSRFTRVSYEAFCRDPGALLSQVARLLEPATGGPIPIPSLPPFPVSERVKLDRAAFERLRVAIGR